MLKLAQARYAREVRRAALHSGERRSRVRTAAADSTDLSTHQIERDRPSRRRPPTARVIATINSQKISYDVPYTLTIETSNSWGCDHMVGTETRQLYSFGAVGA
eukprot:6172620-Pleurochrysis_carterae.AAC.1